MVIFRPMIIKLFLMYKDSLTGFNPFNYIEGGRYRDPQCMSDIVDSPVFLEHTQDMRTQFLEFKRTYVGVSDVKEFSVCLSLFYDGEQLYKRANDHMWPLLASVLNCDPSYRTKLGLGIFSVCLHNLPINSGAERSMLDDLLTEELKQLENGILFEFKLDNGDTHAVYVQARAICWNLDTRAYEEVFHVSTTPSLFGCPKCARGHGKSMKITGAPAYIGATLFLPDDHALRHLARVSPMPEGYYGENVVVNAAQGAALTELARATRVDGDGGPAEALEAEAQDNAADAEGRGVVERVGTSLRGPHPLNLPAEMSWISTKYPYSMFSEAIDSAVVDTRPQEDVCFIHHDEYVANSVEGQRDELADFLRKGRFLTTPDYIVNSVHRTLGAWVVLKAPKFHQSPIDIMHNAANIVGYILEWVTGGRACDTNTRKLCLAQGRFPFMANRKTVPGWRAGMYSRQLADSVHRCMNIPTVYKRDYQFDLPLHYAGHMNSHQKAMFMLAFCEYFFSFCDLFKPYYFLYCRYAYDLRQTMRPFLPKNDELLVRQVLHVAETLGLFAHMLPDSQQPFVLHQFLDIVNGIRFTGPTKSSACFTGERVMGIAGQGVTNGGVKYILPTTKRLVSKENAVERNMGDYVENKLPFITNSGLYSNNVLKLMGRLTSVVLNLEIKTRLFLDIHEFLTTQLIDCLSIKSPFVRLYYTFEAAFAKWKSSRAAQQRPFPSSFAGWIQELHVIHNDPAGGGFSVEKVKHLVSDVLFIVFGAAQGVDYLSDIELETLSRETMRDVVDQGKVYIADFRTTIKELAEFGTGGMQPIASYVHAVVKGVKLTGRGEKYAEKTTELVSFQGTNRQPVRESEIQNPDNILCNNWHPRFQINSWCKVTDYYIHNTSDVVTKKSYFGQVNYFFRMFVPSDGILNGCAFANIMLRAPKLDKHRATSYIGMDDAQSYVGDKHFVSLNYLDSTAVALSAMDVAGLPLVNPSQVRKNMKYKPKKYKLHFSEKKPEEVDRLYCIELHKEREGLEYSTIEEDNDGTKIFEAKVLEHHRACALLL